MAFRRAFALFVLLLAACGGNPAPADPEPPVSEPEGSVEPPPDPAPPSRRISIFEVDPPYLADPGFWDRPDLFVLSPDHEPLDAWPDEVLDPSRHGLRIIVLLPGDYTGRSNGSLPPGVLYIPASGTAAERLAQRRKNGTVEWLPPRVTLKSPSRRPVGSVCSRAS